MPNFELKTELQSLIRRDFPVATATLLQPLNANPIVDGEWLELNSSQKLARGAPGGANNEGLSALVFPVHTEKGRYDTQALGKANILYLGMFEAWTKVVHLAGLSVGSALTVADVSFESLTRRGVRLAGAEAGRVVVGYVTKLLTAESKIEFVSFGREKHLA